MNELNLDAAPHIRGRSSVSRTMLCVLLALLPAAVAGCVSFGRHSAMVLLFTTFTAVFTEALCCLVLRRPQTVTDCSAAVTGLILGMTLPPDIPITYAVIGSAAAIILFKQLFGGLGKTLVNPAAAGHLLLLVCFMKYMTVWRDPMTNAVTYETPLTEKGATYLDLLLGNTAGNIGEVCAVGLLLGGIFLCFTRIISPVTPLAFLGSFALLSFIGGYDVIAQLLSGGLLLAAFFMASDYSTTPLTASGKCVFGLGCGILTFLIRHFGGWPEGVIFAVIIMNLASPLIGRLTRTVPFGAVMPEKPAKKEKASKAAAEQNS